jgi:voltage-gated sodium channel
VTFILVATFTMLNLFIAIIVNAMQSYQEAEHQETVQALHETQDHIEGELHAEMRSLRTEMAALKILLEHRGPTVAAPPAKSEA